FGGVTERLRGIVLARQYRWRVGVASSERSLTPRRAGPSIAGVPVRLSGRAAAAWSGAALALALSVGHFIFSARAVLRRGFADFPIFMTRAADFLHTGQLYVSVDNLVAYGPGTPVYKYPPFYALFLLPFAHADLRQVEYYHWLLQIALYLLAVVL